MEVPNSPEPKKVRQVRSNVKIMLINFLMLMELCRRNLFLLDKLWSNNFIYRCWKDYVRVYGKKNTRNVEQRWLVPSPRPWVCSSFWQKTTWRLSISLPIHPTLRHATFSSSLVWNARWKGKVLLISAKWKWKRSSSWTTAALKSSRNVFSSWKNVGTTSVLSQK